MTTQEPHILYFIQKIKPRMRGLKILAGTGIIALLVLFFRDSISYILSANPVFFIGSVLCYEILNVLLAYRIQYLLKNMGIEAKFADVFKAHLAGMIAGDFTPGRAGYFSTPVFASSYSIDSKAVMGAILSAQAVEMVVKVFGASIGIAYLLGLDELYLIVLPFLISALAVIYLWTNIPPDFEKLRMIRKYARETKRNAVFILGISLAGWIVVGIQWYLIFKALGLDVSFFQSMILQPLGTLLMFLPLTPGGMGLFESGSGFMVSVVTGSISAGIAHSILVRASTILADIPGIIEFRKESKEFRIQELFS